MFAEGIKEVMLSKVKGGIEDIRAACPARVSIMGRPVARGGFQGQAGCACRIASSENGHPALSVITLNFGRCLLAPTGGTGTCCQIKKPAPVTTAESMAVADLAFATHSVVSAIC
jgi:hypothetical protein